MLAKFLKRGCFFSLLVAWTTGASLAHADESFNLKDKRDILSLVASILKRHPGFVSLNSAYRRNLIEVYGHVAKMADALGKDAGPLNFGATDFISARYSLVPVEYSETRLREIKDTLLRGLDALPLTELTSVEKDIEAIKAKSTVDGKIDPKHLRKFAQAYVNLLPLLYDGELKPRYKSAADFQAAARNEIQLLDPHGLDNLYRDLYRGHQLAQLAAIRDRKEFAFFKEAINASANHFERKVESARTPLPIKTEGKQEIRPVSIERVPPVIGVVRGCFGGDCSINTVPHFPLVKGTWVYWIRKSSDLGAQPDGYALVTTIQHEGKSLPYIITVNGGRLAAGDVQAVKHLVARDFQVGQVFTHDFSKGTESVVNSATMRAGLRPERGQARTVSLPSGWSVASKDASLYYGEDKLKHAVLENLSENPLHFSEMNQKKIETPYPRLKNIGESSRFERAQLVAQTTQDESASQDILDAMVVKPLDVKLAREFLSLHSGRPMGIDLYRQLTSHFGLDSSVLASTDVATAAASLGSIRKSNAQIIPPQEVTSIAERLQKSINAEVAGLLREGGQLGPDSTAHRFSHWAKAAVVLSEIHSPKLDDLRRDFAELILSDALESRRLARVESETLYATLKTVLPADLGPLTDRSIATLANSNWEAGALAEQLLLARPLPAEYHVPLLRQLADPDADDLALSVVKSLPSLQVDEKELVPRLVDDPDVGLAVLSEVIPRLSAPLSPEQTRHVYQTLLARSEFDRSEPIERSLANLGPIPAELKVEFRSRTQMHPSGNLARLFIEREPQIFPTLPWEARMRFLNNLGNQESTRNLISQLQTFLTREEWLRTFQLVFARYLENPGSESWRTLAQEMARPAERRLALGEWFLKRKDYEGDYASWARALGPFISWPQWQKEFKAVSRKSWWGGITDNEEQLFRTAFSIGGQMPAAVEKSFWKWLRNRMYPDDALVAARSESSHPTQVSSQFYDEMFKSVEQRKIRNLTAVNFFAYRPSDRHFDQFLKILPEAFAGESIHTSPLTVLLDSLSPHDPKFERLLATLASIRTFKLNFIVEKYGGLRLPAVQQALIRTETESPKPYDKPHDPPIAKATAPAVSPPRTNVTYISHLDPPLLGEPERRPLIEMLPTSADWPEKRKFIQAYLPHLTQKEVGEVLKATGERYLAQLLRLGPPSPDSPIEDTLQVHQLVSQNPLAKAALLERMLAGGISGENYGFYQKTVGAPLDWTSWKSRYSQSSEMEKTALWQMAFYLSEPMPSSVQEEFRSWLKQKKAPAGNATFSWLRSLLVGHAEQVLINEASEKPSIPPDELIGKLISDFNSGQLKDSLALYLLKLNLPNRFAAEFIQVVPRLAQVEPVLMNRILFNTNFGMKYRKEIFLALIDSLPALGIDVLSVMRRRTPASELKDPEVIAHIVEVYPRVGKAAGENLKSMLPGVNLNGLLAVSESLSAYTLAENWLKQDELDTDSNWLSVAELRGLKPEQLIEVLRRDQTKHDQIILKFASYPKLLFRLLRGIPIRDEILRRAFFQPALQTLEPIPGVAESLDANLPLATPKEIKTYVEWISEKFAQVGFNSENELVKGGMPLLEKIASHPHSVATVLDPDLNQRHQFALLGARHRIGKPVSWDQWRAAYAKLKPPTFSRRATRNKAIAPRARLLELAFYLPGPMPKDVEKIFWKHVAKGDIPDAFHTAVAPLAYSVPERWVPPRTTVSDEFYERILGSVEAGTLDPQTAVRFYLLQPSPSQYEKFFRLLEKVWLDDSLVWLLDHSLTKGTLVLRREQRLELLTKALRAFSAAPGSVPHYFKFIRHQQAGLEEELKPLLLRAFATSSSNAFRKDLKAYFLEVGIEGYDVVQLAPRCDRLSELKDPK